MAKHTYEEGWDAVIARYEARRIPIRFGPSEALPDLDTDLRAALTRPVDPDTQPKGKSEFARKRAGLAQEFAGAPELFLLHALVISCLRKSDYPAHAPALFRKIWADCGTDLCRSLPSRWLISAAITFETHGETASEIALAASVNVLFSYMKLSEYERLYSGRPPEQIFPLRDKVKADLPMGLEPFALRKGGLDINLIAPLIVKARAEPLLGPIVLELFERMNRDPATLFRRLAKMRGRLEARAARQEIATGQVGDDPLK